MFYGDGGMYRKEMILCRYEKVPTPYFSTVLLPSWHNRKTRDMMSFGTILKNFLVGQKIAFLSHKNIFLVFFKIFDFLCVFFFKKTFKIARK
jgi:hypothetical protein